MRREDILELKKGRDTDNVVAEHVIGLKSAGDGWYWIKGMMDELPEYSTDMGFAKQVMDKMDEIYIERNGKGYMVMTGMDFDSAMTVDDDDLAYAICIVALLEKFS